LVREIVPTEKRELGFLPLELSEDTLQPLTEEELELWE